MSNVNNLNGVPNFGEGDIIPTEEAAPAIDEASSPAETEVKEKKIVKKTKTK